MSERLLTQRSRGLLECVSGERGGRSQLGPGTNYFGGNTSCVDLTTANGDLLIFDCGTGAHRLAAELMAQGKSHSREHSPRTYALGSHSRLSVLQPGLCQRELRRDLWPEGSRGSLHDVLAGQMEFTYFPIELSQLPAAITYHDLTEGIHTIGGARVATQFLHHPAMMALRSRRRGGGVPGGPRAVLR